ncbi:MAG: IS701 family transposase [Acidimicrobiales bacterium]
MSRPGSTWRALLMGVASAFTSPSFTLFLELTSAWVCTTGRRTITGMITVMDPATRGAHDAYHRLIRAGAWNLESLWEAMAAMVVQVVDHLSGDGALVCVLDDTLFHRPGRRVDGAGSFRDAVRSTARRVVYARGLNLVVLALRVTPPWGGQPLAIPVGVALHPKGGPTTTELARQLMTKLAERLPGRSFVLCADGAYACLAGDHLPRTEVVSRMRRDAALYEAAPPRTGKRGRPRTKGERLGTPVELAGSATGWRTIKVDWRGQLVTKSLWSIDVLWYRVCPDAMVRLVVVRDPAGKEPDDFFFTTDLDMTPAEVASIYASRWPIEVCFRDVKQVAHGQEPQTWKGEGPFRAASLSFWLHGAVWVWYLGACGAAQTWPVRAWYPTKRAPSFADAMAELRRVLWRERISGTSGAGSLDRETSDLIIEALAMAA